MGVGTVLLAAEIARHLFGSRVALYTAALMAVFPSLVYYTAEAHLETVFNFLVLAAVLILVAGSWREVSRGRLLLFGFVLGLSALVRPFSLLVLPGLVLVWLLSGTRWRPALARAAWAALAVVVVVSPWVARNIVVMKAPVFSTGIGDALCDSRHEGATGAFEVAAKYCLVGYAHLPYDEQEVQRNQDNTRKALRFVVEHPVDEARLMFWRGYYAYRDDHDALVVIDADPAHPLRESDFRPVLSTLADAYYVAVVALGLLGLPALLRRRHPKRLFVAVVLLGTATLPFILFGDPRYHVPVLPFLVIAAAAALGARRGAGSRARRHAQHRRTQRQRHPGDDGAFEPGEEQGGGVDGGRRDVEAERCARAPGSRRRAHTGSDEPAEDVGEEHDRRSPPRSSSARSAARL